MVGGGHAWLLKRGMHGGGACMVAKGVCMARGACMGGHARAVRILLECILVYVQLSQFRLIIPYFLSQVHHVMTIFPYEQNNTKVEPEITSILNWGQKVFCSVCFDAGAWFFQLGGAQMQKYCGKGGVLHAKAWQGGIRNVHGPTSRGACVAVKGGWSMDQSGRDTAGHCAGGTHPTGMHSCLCTTFPISTNNSLLPVPSSTM